MPTKRWAVYMADGHTNASAQADGSFPPSLWPALRWAAVRTCPATSSPACPCCRAAHSPQGCDGGRLYYDGCASVVVNGQLVAQASTHACVGLACARWRCWFTAGDLGSSLGGCPSRHLCCLPPTTTTRAGLPVLSGRGGGGDGGGGSGRRGLTSRRHRVAAGAGQLSGAGAPGTR